MVKLTLTHIKLGFTFYITGLPKMIDLLSKQQQQQSSLSSSKSSTSAVNSSQSKSVRSSYSDPIIIHPQQQQNIINSNVNPAQPVVNASIEIEHQKGSFTPSVNIQFIKLVKHFYYFLINPFDYNKGGAVGVLN